MLQLLCCVIDRKNFFPFAASKKLFRYCGNISHKQYSHFLALIVLAILIAVGALAGICGICICYSRYKVSQRAVHAYPNIYPMPKFGTIFLPNGPANGSHDKIYETQVHRVLLLGYISEILLEHISTHNRPFQLQSI